MKRNSLQTTGDPSTHLPHQDNQTPSFITAYGPKLVVQKHFNGPGRTKQSFKDECDINQIMARYQKTGVIDFVNKHQAQYGDATGLDFQEAMQMLTKAQSMFNDLPSQIRNRFHNDPGEFLDFVHDPDNASEMAEMGLMRPDYQPPSKDAAAAFQAPPGTTPPPAGDPPKPADSPASASMST